MASLSGAPPPQFHRPRRILRHLPEDEDGSEAGPVERLPRRLTESPQLALPVPTTNGALVPWMRSRRLTPTARMDGV